jgi:hypothetical protein
MKEIREITPLVKKWLMLQGYYPQVKKGGREGADIEAKKRDQLWVVEAKGEQRNVGAYRNTWFTGLGQLAVARSRYPEATWLSLALSSDKRYVEYVEMYKDVFAYLRVSVIWVYDNDHIFHVDPQSPQFPCPHCSKGIGFIRKINHNTKLTMCGSMPVYKSVCPHCERELHCY